AKLAPVQDEVKKRIGNFIIAEDNETLESVVLAALTGQGSTLALAETFTGGLIASRLVPMQAALGILRRSLVSRDKAELHRAVGIAAPPPGEFTEAEAATIAEALARESGATHALSVLIDVDEGPDRRDLG